jgi:hypothetical protein
VGGWGGGVEFITCPVLKKHIFRKQNLGHFLLFGSCHETFFFTAEGSFFFIPPQTKRIKQKKVALFMSNDLQLFLTKT